ncbi:MAG: hypothetical protein V2A61_00345 [Calditrichota bacterium]
MTIWREDEPALAEAGEGVMKLIFRLHTEHVAYPILSEINIQLIV